MAPVTLPPSFFNSFWSPDYRSGLEVLFKNLEQGCLENDDVAEFIDSQIRSHHSLAQSLLNPPLSNTDSSHSTSLQHTLLSLKGASSARGEAHRALAIELEQRVIFAFKSWKERHQVRINEGRADVLGKGGVVALWEKEAQKLTGLRQTYLVKSRAADDSEDDAKFAPATDATRSPPMDNYTSSPKMPHAKLARTVTVADRISEKLRAASISSNGSNTIPQSPSSPSRRSVISVDGKTLPPPPSPLRPVSHSPDGMASPSSPTREERFVPPTDPDGKPFIHGQMGPPPVPSKNGAVSPLPDVPPPPILLSGLSLPAQGLKDLLHRLDAYLLTNPAPYSDAPHTPSTRSNAALASRQRSTILGTYERTFSGEEIVEWLKENVEGFGGDWDRCVDAAGEIHKMGYFSRIGVGRGFDPSDDTYFVLKIQGNETPSAIANLTSPLSPPSATHALPSLFKSYLPASLGNTDEPAHIRLRREATKADEAYKEGVRNVEDKRLEMEESIEKGLRLWERWERERLSVVKTVLKQYEEALARLPGRLGELQKGTSLSVEAFNPEADIKALIEGNRTGPFRPHPHIYESVESDVPDVNFGIDLRRWSGDQGWKSLVNAPPRPKGAIPEALQALLSALDEMYTSVPDDERRKAWIYEVPLVETHMLRNALNNPHISVEDLISIVKKFNLPIAAGTVKLYLLELNPPVLGWEGWEDAKAVYPAIGADQERDMSSAVSSVLGRLPGAQLYVLDAVVKHYRNLVDSTKTPEANEVYVTKLALSVGRTILRPQYETDLTIGDRTPSLFLADLINHYSAIFPPLVEKKKKEADRVMPIRKRTALVDQRLSRSRLSGGGEVDSLHLLELQRAMQNPPKSAVPNPAPPPKAQSSPVTSNGSGSGLGAPIQDIKMQEPRPIEKESVPPASAPSSPPQNPAPASVPEVEGRPTFAEPDLDDSPPPRVRALDPEPEQQEVLRAREPQPEPTRPTEGEPHQPESYERPPSAAAGGIKTAASTVAANAADDEVISSGVGGLKRASSGEVSRLRGPRGARGPRPAPGRIPSHTATPSLGSIINAYSDDTPPAPPSASGSAGGGRESPSLASPITRSRPTSPPNTADLRRGKAFGHGSRGSVSAAIAQFENSKK